CSTNVGPSDGGGAVGMGAGSSVGAGTSVADSGGTGTGTSAGGQTGSGGTASGHNETSRVSLAPRLSKFEYRNSILDVLGVSLLPEEMDASLGGVPDDAGDGVFKHLSDHQTSVEQHALAYGQVAEAV